MLCIQEHTCSLDRSGAAALRCRPSYCVLYSRLFQCSYRGPDGRRSRCCWRGGRSMGKRCSDWSSSERLMVYQLLRSTIWHHKGSCYTTQEANTTGVHMKTAPASRALMSWFLMAVWHHAVCWSSGHTPTYESQSPRQAMALSMHPGGCIAK